MLDVCEGKQHKVGWWRGVVGTVRGASSISPAYSSPGLKRLALAATMRPDLLIPSRTPVARPACVARRAVLPDFLLGGEALAPVVDAGLLRELA